MAAGLGRSVLALLAVACRGERGRGFVVVTIQRTGSTWLADELDVHPCIVSGEELFLNGKSGPAPFVWSDSWKHKALEALFSDGSAVEFTLNATVNSLKVLKRCRAARDRPPVPRCMTARSALHGISDVRQSMRRAVTPTPCIR